jgi:hypothetical protein
MAMALAVRDRHRLARVDLQGEWRILIVTNMADDETGAPGV